MKHTLTLAGNDAQWVSDETRETVQYWRDLIEDESRPYADAWLAGELEPKRALHLFAGESELADSYIAQVKAGTSTPSTKEPVSLYVQK